MSLVARRGPCLSGSLARLWCWAVPGPDAACHGPPPATPSSSAPPAHSPWCSSSPGRSPVIGKRGGDRKRHPRSLKGSLWAQRSAQMAPWARVEWHNSTSFNARDLWAPRGERTVVAASSLGGIGGLGRRCPPAQPVRMPRTPRLRHGRASANAPTRPADGRAMRGCAAMLTSSLSSVPLPRFLRFRWHRCVPAV